MTAHNRNHSLCGVNKTCVLQHTSTAPYRDLFPYTCIMCRGDCILHCFNCAIIPTLFPYFLPFWYPYINFIVYFFAAGALFELRFAVTEQKSVTSQAPRQ